MKKLAKLLTLLFAVTVLCFTLTACGGSSDPQPTPTPSVSTSPSTAPTEVTSEFFTLSGTTFSVTVPNSQATLELSDKFHIPQGVSAQLYKEMGGTGVLLTSTLVSLYEGENVYSLVVTMPTGFPKTYAVVITRNPTYAVYFNTQGSSVETQYVENGFCATQPTQNPTRAGYVFTGWDYDFTTPVTQSITVNAQWQGNLNTLKFEGNGATSGEMVDMQIRSGATAVLTANGFTKTGYTFLGWATSAEGSVRYQNGAEYTMGTDSEYTLYAVWQEPYTEGLTFTKNGNTYYVSGYTGSSTTVTIPVKYMGYPVTSIGRSAFYNCYSITEIVIPNSVTSIGVEAFYSCYSLTTVTFGDNSQLTSIGNSAFYWCDSLTEIVIPEGVTSIGERAFVACDSLTIYCEAASEPSGWSSGWNSGRPVVWNCKNNEVAEDGAIYKTIDGIRYALKDGVATVVEQPRSISGSITIPASVTYKGTAYAVTSIGSSAFDSCDSLTEIVIPDSVTSIGNYAFYSCDSLTTVTFGENSQLTSIGYQAFSFCDSLTEIVIPNSVTSIGNYEFSSCYSLTTVTFGDNSQLTSIGERAFSDCYSLTEIVIPDNVTSIDWGAFYKCDSLTIYCEATSEPSGWSWHWNKKDDYGSLPVVWNCKNNEVATDGAIYKIIDGIRYALKDGVATVVEQPRNIVGSIAIPTNVTYNGSTYAVTSIGSKAFSNCDSLTEIVIPNSVTSIGYRAFYDCDSLTTVTFGDNSQLTSIGNSAFYWCDSLTEIVIPSSVTSIGEWAFHSCTSLTEIVIPNSVTSIGSVAFYNCYSLTIYCEAASKPKGWDSGWNVKDDHGVIPVVWGYTGE
ncbi:MAG: hypothetical protein E7363_06395 [Clostridiales bacterium]|nr:hypothetical protein [Clostridiales bacterium]